ncbi:MAG: phosphate ABC transporter substrate-binding protein PstS [Actinophytocola sp.]|uniref:phosphate ABC transporter substrate-binding protein PstS n=1 Tax=Actinophytocola sp. TaxID=1872138 RepID=UPI001322FD69|nr:phosphate ABC transporter substrate-binding protein PstS [Actinophytocola sp.]MPZ80553.1 phosphate ABC transporter substrate-binding protein PstS [Actinophytocola sp.]
MKRIRYGRIAALVAASALALTACGNDPAPSGSGDSNGGGSEQSNLAGKLAGAGASSQEAAMQAWIAGFGSANPDVTVSYDPAGSGAGRTQFGEGAVDWAGSDAVMDDEERAAAEERCGSDAIHLPLYISPIAVVYNLDNVDNLQLSAATVAGIFDRKITRWDDPKIKADNPDATLPGTAVTPVNRSDESGTTENFTDYLSVVAPEAWPHEASGEWPLKGGQSAQGTSGVVQTVSGGQGTIGYADASQAGQLGKAKIKVGENFVDPSAEAAAKIVDESERVSGGPEHDLAYELKRDTTAEGTYPIVLVSYIIVCEKYSDATQGDLVKAFVGYISSEKGQKAAAEAAGSAPIYDTLRTDVDASIESIGAGS